MLLEKLNAKEGTHLQYLTPELLFLAKSGQPYRGVVYISYTTLGESFNLLDFKKYITSLRSQTFLAEDIAYEIYNTIDNSIKSKNLGVVVDLSARGGIQQRVAFGTPFEVIQKSNIFQM